MPYRKIKFLIISSKLNLQWTLRKKRCFDYFDNFDDNFFQQSSNKMKSFKVKLYILLLYI